MLVNTTMHSWKDKIHISLDMRQIMWNLPHSPAIAGVSPRGLVVAAHGGPSMLTPLPVHVASPTAVALSRHHSSGLNLSQYSQAEKPRSRDAKTSHGPFPDWPPISGLDGHAVVRQILEVLDFPQTLSRAPLAADYFKPSSTAFAGRQHRQFIQPSARKPPINRFRALPATPTPRAQPRRSTPPRNPHREAKPQRPIVSASPPPPALTVGIDSPSDGQPRKVRSPAELDLRRRRVHIRRSTTMIPAVL
ncbi:hypothetical protein STAS_00861 [Striga asiatica]|uniref:Uncharacterized protein n=1 Tax=Striga asiatica TaxID=4170 RepID=A0A5A7NYD4_STRAF|nr:hypothetical protein STAS_00861 [Striga asiatica]